MAVIDSNTVKGIAIGMGAVLLVPVALVAAGRSGRPAARALVKAGLLAYEKGREAVAELGEMAEDLVAEARMEIEQEREARAEAAEAAAEETAGEPAPGPEAGEGPGTGRSE